MVATAVLNGALGLLAVITYAFCIKDLPTALATSTGYPVIDIFYAATGSKAATTAMTMIIITLLIASGISILATASRQVFAFAQDDGLPFPHLWRKVNDVGIEVPLNAILLSLSVTVLLVLVNIGSTAAFNSIVSLLISSLFAGYFISIGCVFLKRLRGEPLPPSRWSMGQFTIPINAFSLLYIAFALIMSFFPTIEAGLTPRSMNWSVLVLCAVLGFAIGVYIISGRYIYRGPAVYVNRSLGGHQRGTHSSGR
jgi:choline transport protein